MYQFKAPEKPFTAVALSIAEMPKPPWLTEPKVLVISNCRPAAACTELTSEARRRAQAHYERRSYSAAKAMVTDSRAKVKYEGHDEGKM